jgi:carbonic anhydrase
MLDRAEEFRRLAAGQSPLAIFVTCSDSRVQPQLFTACSPGDLFVIRNAGNIVPKYGHSSSEGAAIEYAICALATPNIIVCGHSHCGAMGGLLNRESLAAVPKVRSWVDLAERALEEVEKRGIECAVARLDAMVKQNVLLQLEHLMTYPYIAERFEKGELALHGWLYEIDSGRVFAHESGSGEFRPLADTQLAKY